MPARKFTSILLIFLFLFLFRCGDTTDHRTPQPNHVILVSPSSFSLESFLILTEKNIISIPNLDLTVVYHEGSPDRYRHADRVLKQRTARNIHLVKVQGELRPDNLFGENECTNSFRKLFEGSQGIFFFGGDDIPPRIFKEKTHLLTDIETPDRHYFELSFLFHLLGGSQDTSYVPFLQEKPEYVVVGFCLGMQTMNVATGGSLIQDIPTEVYNLTYVEDILNLDPDQQHRNYWSNLVVNSDISSYIFHRISLPEAGFFTERLGIQKEFQPLVFSSHHQAVENVGKDLKIEAVSLDGNIIEALSHSRYPNVLGVQFHPERYLLYDSTATTYRYSPQDTVLRSEYAVLADAGSLDFHLRFWKFFSDLLGKKD